MKYLCIAILLIACNSQKTDDDQKVNETIYDTNKAVEDSKKEMQDLKEKHMQQRRADSVERGYRVKVN